MILLQKDFLSALCMTAVTLLFAAGLDDLYGEARTIPQMLVIAMAVINVVQYLLALKHRKLGESILPLLRAYPFAMVGRLFALTVAYILTLQWLGFYIGSFVYIFLGALMADPVRAKLPRVLILLLGCGLFIFGLYALFTLGLGVLIPMGSLWH